MTSGRETAMYQDAKRCRACGAEVRLSARGPVTPPDGPVGPVDGVVGSGDPTVDERTCTNADCPSHRAGSGVEV